MNYLVVLFWLILGLEITSTAGATTLTERDFFDGIHARNIGPYRGGRALAVAGLRQDPHIYYAGTTGGLWKTSNAGATWQVISDGYFNASAVGAIAVAASDPNIVIAGTGESCFRNVASSQGDGVYKSTDAGVTWTHLGFNEAKQIGEIRIHPKNPDILWVAVQGNIYQPSESTGVFKSNDGGRTWRRVLTPLNKSTGAVDLALNFYNPHVLYAAMWDNQRTAWSLRSGGPGSGIWRSVDEGENWERLTETLPQGMGKIGIAVSPIKTDRVWALIEAEGDKGGLYRSDDAGESWIQINKDRLLFARSWYYMHIFADPNDENTLYVLNESFLRSVDGGVTFSSIQVPHSDNHYLWINPNNSKWMINANDGGANITFDGGKTWSRQDNQPTGQFYRVNTDNQFEYRIYGGQQDHSTVVIKSRDRDGGIGRDDWEIHGGCESAYVAFNHEDPRLTYSGCYLGLIQEFDTETRTVRSVKAYEEVGLGQRPSELKYRFNWNAPIHVSLHDPNVIYHAANVLLKSENRGFNWVEISPDLTRNEDDKQGSGAGPYTNENNEVYNTISSIAESPFDDKIIWAGTDDGLVNVTFNGGTNWSNVSPPGTGRGIINSIEVSPHKPGVTYIVVMKYKEGDNNPYIYRTTNFGKSWKKITNGLPEGNFARAIREDKSRPNLLFAGMERGLYFSLNGGDSWRPLQLNLPIVPITDLMVRRNDLVVATQGRGFWVIDDISPLRQYFFEHESVSSHLYNPSVAYRLTPTKGASNGGENFAPSAPDGAIIYFSLSDNAVIENHLIKIEVLNENGKVIRTLHAINETDDQVNESTNNYEFLIEKGINRVVWDLRSDEITPVAYEFLYGAPPGENIIPGYTVKPGIYDIHLWIGDSLLKSKVTVKWDPNIEYDESAISEQQNFLTRLYAMINGIYKRINSLEKIREQVLLRKSLIDNEVSSGSAKEAADLLLSSLEEWQQRVTSPKRTNNQDVLNFEPKLDAFLIELFQNVDAAVLGVTQGQRDRMYDLETQWEEAKQAWTILIEKAVTNFNRRTHSAVFVSSWE